MPKRPARHNVLDGRPPDLVPCDYWATAETTSNLLRELHCADEIELWKRLGVFEEAVNPPLPRARTVRDIDRHPWPDASEWDTAQIIEDCRRFEDWSRRSRT